MMKDTCVSSPICFSIFLEDLTIIFLQKFLSMLNTVPRTHTILPWNKHAVELLVGCLDLFLSPFFEIRECLTGTEII